MAALSIGEPRQARPFARAGIRLIVARRGDAAGDPVGRAATAELLAYADQDLSAGDGKGVERRLRAAARFPYVVRAADAALAAFRSNRPRRAHALIVSALRQLGRASA
ncbi:hypothetical protein [Conexibacter sp. CPCC 206217]|uniref:hypothetical protein n=1 Tax=Conexibacter sp. CPCC 206217 TaxID=3064574 RepID=UPI002717D023|nr:hypothetical protein [Conexibacter sp. CPCC 206217]MDO8208899.1 hypothetical protein [Conexibacter sp. CPCC 206217]